ncbi:MAG: HNH endonuclease [Salinibacterium sp.]|nr:HNH endonuclease [Salinibacterium sp.]
MSTTTLLSASVSAGAGGRVRTNSISPGEASRLGDDDLLATGRQLADERRIIDASAAVISAEIAHRSRRELGYDGLAQRRGMRTPEALVQQLTGLSGADARTLVRIGTLVTEHSPDLSRGADERDDTARTPWLAEVADAVASGLLSVGAADAIRLGLGAPNDDVTVRQLTGAAHQLLQEAATLTLERLTTLARRYRDELDEGGVADREAERRDRRYLHITPRPDGMTRISGLLDPESAAIIVGAVDAITAPRRGGPRFVDAAEAARAEKLVNDARTNEQLAVDALVDLVRVATLADDGKVLGARRVAVRLHVTEHDLRRGQGFARLEGQPDAVSIATAERHACESGVVPILFDSDGCVVNVGRDQRNFTPRQRIGLAARDGGCRFPQCDRPPSWTEAHHVRQWERDHGETNIDNGILLCRHHHMLVHNNGWEIEQHDHDFVLRPPPRSGSSDPISMPSKRLVK